MLRTVEERQKLEKRLLLCAIVGTWAWKSLLNASVLTTIGMPFAIALVVGGGLAVVGSTLVLAFNNASTIQRILDISFLKKNFVSLIFKLGILLVFVGLIYMLNLSLAFQAASSVPTGFTMFGMSAPDIIALLTVFSTDILFVLFYTK